MKMPALLSRSSEALPGTVGLARVYRNTTKLLTRVGEGDIVVLDEIDLDRVTADALVEARVAAVVNASESISGRYPNLGPEVLVAAGITLIDAAGEDVLRKIKDGDGRYIVESDVSQLGSYRLFGSGVIITNRVPEGKAGLVDFSQIAVARDVAPSVKILDQTFGNYDQQAIRVTARFDAKPLNPEAVVKLTGITI